MNIILKRQRARPTFEIRQSRGVFTLRMLMLALFAVYGVSACIPAETPPQLSRTPGPAAVITDKQVIMPSGYTVQRPADWRILLSAADAPEGLTLIAPDARSVIVVSPHADYPLPSAETIPDPERIVVERSRSGPDDVIYLWLITTSADLENKLTIVTKTLESVTFREEPSPVITFN